MASDGHRPIGGVGEPAWTDEALPALSRAGGLTVGVIDTGIVLDGRGRPPAWFGRHHLSYCRAEDADESAYPRGERLPSDGHGTFVAGLVLREAPTARVRMWGVLAKARVPVAVDESDEKDDRAVAAALAALAINRQVQVVNLSFGDAVEKRDEQTPKEQRSLDTLEAAVVAFRQARPDVAIVAAAGNNGITSEVYPAALEGVLSVGAVDERDFEPGTVPPIAEFSNHGDWVRAYARGVDVLGPLPRGDQRWARWKGTSFAAAVVSGRIAQVAIERGITGTEAQQAVLDGSDAIQDTGAVWVHSVDSVNRVATF